MNTYIEPGRKEWPLIITRPALNYTQLNNSVNDILQDVKETGDAALKKYTRLFDHLDIENFKISKDQISRSVELISSDLIEAINAAKNNIEKFHKKQKENFEPIETTVGVTCWRRSLPVQKVGLYIPGGSAPLFSTLLMLAIPASIAGCNEIVVCTPPDKDGMVHPAILYVAHILGLDNVFKIGGPQAIAAMAYGTQTIPRVFKIFGPGNQYVTAAKQTVSALGTAIDMPAGPSEVAIYADNTSNPAFVAADLLSQAEHGIDSQVLLVATSSDIIELVKEQIELQSTHLLRKDIIDKCLVNSHFVAIEDEELAFDLINEYAPEHLIIASDNALALSERVINSGSVFLGHYTPESAGDYASGTNHTLPTNGNARAYSGVSLDSFIKKVTFQQLSPVGINNLGKHVQVMAAAEGLDAHKNAVTVRLDELKKM